MKRTLAIWLPNWPIQRLRRQQTTPSNAPAHKAIKDSRLDRSAHLATALVLQQRNRKGQCVVAVCPTAWEMGIRPEMPVAEAKSIALQTRTAPQPRLQIQDYEPDADQLALEKLAIWAHQFSPLTGIDDSEPPETLLLDLQHASDLYGNERQAVNEIHNAFKRLQLHVRIGVASTIGAAWALAHFSKDLCTILSPQTHHEGIAKFPMQALRISDVTLNQLDRLGLRQVDQLFPLPRTAMQSRFGNQLLKRLDQALGAAPELIHAVKLPPEFKTDWHFETPIEHRPTIDQVIQQLIQRLCQMLRDHQRGALQVRCALKCQSGVTPEVKAGMFQPSACPDHILKLLNMHLEQTQLSSPVTRITIVATAHDTFDDEQSTILDQPKRQHRSPLVGSVLDRIAGRLGRDAVLRCKFVEDAQPEQAIRYEPAIGSKNAHSAPRQATNSKRRYSPTSNDSNHRYAPETQPLDRPLHLMAQPDLIKTRSQLKGGPIQEFTWNSQCFRIAKLWGPERIETGWWRRRGIRRDYYRVETYNGNRFWLFRCLKNQQWYLHGTFG